LHDNLISNFEGIYKHTNFEIINTEVFMCGCNNEKLEWIKIWFSFI